MTKLEIIYTSILAAFTLIVIIYFLIKLIKNGMLKTIINKLGEAMKEAEEKQLSGERKKQYVLDVIQKECENQGIPYGFIAGLISKTIEQIIKGYNTMIK